ncbi:MAG: hypothetical protein JO218_04445 [Burkholderiales bacterium]|nr:hypothetical protein [Burkholderiales bacterium]
MSTEVDISLSEVSLMKGPSSSTGAGAGLAILGAGTCLSPQQTHLSWVHRRSLLRGTKKSASHLGLRVIPPKKEDGGDNIKAHTLRVLP